MKAYVLIRIRAGEIGEALRQLKGLKGVVRADMTFGPFDAIATIEAGGVNEIGRMVAWDIQPIIGVTETTTCLAVEPN